MGLFLCLHLAGKALQVRGAAGPGDALEPSSTLAEVPLLRVVVLASLLFHALSGLLLVFRARYNVGRYPYSRNWMYTLQRVTGLLAFGFVALHAANIAWPVAAGEVRAADAMAAMSASLSATQAGIPLFALGYMLGVAACALHFGNGVWGFCVSWGIATTRRARQRLGAVCGLLGLALLLLGANTTIHLATGQALRWPSSEPDAEPAEQIGSACPVTSHSAPTPATAAATAMPPLPSSSAPSKTREE